MSKQSYAEFHGATSKPDIDEVHFGRIGDFSIRGDEKFEKHIARLSKLPKEVKQYYRKLLFSSDVLLIKWSYHDTVFQY